MRIVKQVVFGIGLMAAGLIAGGLIGSRQALAELPAGDPGQVVASVNGSPILARDYSLAVQLQFRRRARGQRGHGDLDVVRARALETLIDNELLYQEARAHRIDIDEDEIDRELTQVVEGFGSRANLEQVLQASAVSIDEFRAQLRRSIVVVRYLEQEIVGDISISNEEIKRYYDGHPDEMVRKDGVRISQIVIELPSDASREVFAAARRQIEGILAEFRSGKEFDALARKHSDGPEAARGGDSGVVTRGGGALPAVERAALALQPGEMSDIVESRRGLHIILATGMRPGGVIPLEEAKADIRARLELGQREAKVAAHLAGLREKARIERTLPGSS